MLISVGLSFSNVNLYFISDAVVLFSLNAFGSSDVGAATSVLPTVVNV
jgi:hypothetical protein